MEYPERAIDKELDELLPELPAIALDGPKGVGKTETCRRRAGSVVALDRDRDREVFVADPERITRITPPVLVDEWQLAPSSWDVVRRAVDDGAPAGSFLLTGSSTPLAKGPGHSGAGRIVSLRMRPMSFPERNLENPTVGLGELLGGGARIAGESGLGLADYAEEITRSGLPGIRGLGERARRLQLDGYLARITRRLLDGDGEGVAPRGESLGNWLRAYAAATSTTAAFEAIRDAATPGDADTMARTTAIRYRGWLDALRLLDPVPAWRAPGSVLRRLSAGPKHHLADPALAARALDVDVDLLLDGQGRVISGHGTLLGALFESLVTLTVRVLAQGLEARVWHLRTHRGEHEIALLVEGRGGALVGVEVKLSASVTDRDVKHLLWLRDQLGDKVKDLVVVSTGPTAYRRGDGVAVVPLALLGP